MPIADRRAGANQVNEAGDLLTAVEDRGQQLPTASPTTQQSIDEAKKRVRERGGAFKAKTEAAAKLAADPEDPKYNFIVGAWLAVFEDDWPGALPKLAKGANPPWKQAAEAELNVSLITDEQAKMAGLWWDIANGMNGESSVKLALQRHVLDWYTRIVAKISNPLLKTVVERRIKELKPVLETAAIKPQMVSNTPSPQVPSQSDNVGEGKLPTGEMINLLQMIRLPDHAVEGSWQMIDGTLVSGASYEARVMAPVVLLRNY
ncbi:MAG: hypothetical protein ABI614_26595, partial [Planctomycetota bacterium]